MHAPCSLTSLVVVLAIAAVLSLSITVAVYSPLDWLVPAVAWRFLGGFTTQVRSQTVSIKYNISVSELRTILDPEPNIVVEDYVLDSDENEGGRANLTLYERAAAVAANTVSAKDAEPWLTWAHARFGDAGEQNANPNRAQTGSRHAWMMLPVNLANRRTASGTPC